MSESEKIYLQQDAVTVSASRVILGDKNYVLRNISSVQVFSEEHGVMRAFGLITFSLGGIVLAGVFEVGFFAILGIGIGLLYLLLRDKHFVQVSSGGTPTNTIHSSTKEFPQRVVEAINTALLDLDKRRTSDISHGESSKSDSPADEVMKLKRLLDAGAITQEDFDAKKKELLGL